MTQELRDKLTAELEECDWSMLEVHHTNGAVFIVDDTLELVNVGVSIARDESEQVSRWLSEDSLRRPTDSEVNSWKEDKFKKFAKFLILQPYVIIQLIRVAH